VIPAAGPLDTAGGGNNIAALVRSAATCVRRLPLMAGEVFDCS
jgi:hypothetical protein